MASIRREIASGLIVVAPVAIILLVLQWLYRWIGGFPFVELIEPPIARVPVVLIVFVLVVTAIGYAMRTAFGVLVADLITEAINQVPGLRVVYNASQLAIETIFQGAEGAVEPVKIDSWEGLRVTAFDTGNRTEDGRVLCYFPTAPNITTGYVIEVDEDHIIRTGESVERALMRIISAGFGDHREVQGEGAPFPNGRAVHRVTNVRIAKGE